MVTKLGILAVIVMCLVSKSHTVNGGAVVERGGGGNNASGAATLQQVGIEETSGVKITALNDSGDVGLASTLQAIFS